VYDISHLQIFQADLVRGYRASRPGRRVLATPLHNSTQNPSIESTNLLDPTGPQGSVKIGKDGSIAAFVPATRALTWQTVSPTKEPIVRERQWITFAPGEIRTCPACHGINGKTKAGNDIPQNKPEALRDLLRTWMSDFNDLITSIPEGDVKSVGGVTLYQNHPNPFVNSTEISYQLSKAAHVTLRIYSAQGQLVAVLKDQKETEGTHKVRWNSASENSSPVGTGIYVCSLQVDGRVVSNKMLSIR
jgi:hypothetical protein